MKFAIFFCVVAIACVAQSQLLSLPSNVVGSVNEKIEEAQQTANGLTKQASDLLNKTVDEAKENTQNLTELVTGSVDKLLQGVGRWFSLPSNVVDLVKEKIEEAQQTVNQLIKQASDLLHKTVHEAKENAQNLIKQLKESAEKVKESVTGSVDKIVQGANEEIAEAEKQAKEQGVKNTAECTGIAKRIAECAKNVTVDIVKCVTDKVQTGAKLVNEITKKCTTTVTDLLILKKQIEQCNQSTGVLAKVCTLSCLTTNGAKASWMVTTQIPSLTLDLKQLTDLILTLQPSLQGCIQTNIDAFKKEVKAIVETIRECLGQQIKCIKSG